MSESYLLILGDREPIAWVLGERRIAFPATARAEVDRIAEGDELFVYATRGAFRNPTRDRGRVIARAAVTSPVTVLDEPVTFAERAFPRGCDLRIDSLAPWGGGVELRPLVDRLAAFPDARSWSVRLRRPLLHLPEPDAALLRSALAPIAGPVDENLPRLPSPGERTRRLGSHVGDDPSLRILASGPRRTMLVHGSPQRQRALRETLRVRDRATVGTGEWRP
ncbi:hypothetical protein [Actinomadura algeriensis]|uniref:EVE domain-containing protein n=1 Tax=Actinomadura algeriensis TaxID=1679523 RepID=A0ABR9K4N3_9ACTN|nr:hypothetical protein [Actinomadura algeriensis]MBE1537345.1 hypothetical protein [Actinomadura algeriensis]